ncbi:MAG TPA: hypothetical protein VK760_00170 [Candidatus Acidoferrales bacterium]|nr:hypothetical protein [Candidatus Acidoferrales bacterium]
MTASRISGALAALIFAAGCAGANDGAGTFSPQDGDAASRTAARPSARVFTRIYVANNQSSTVTVYAPHFVNGGGETLERTIRGGLNAPSSIAFDSSGHLFVANAGNVTKYSEIGSTPKAVVATITNGINHPSRVAVDQDDNLWVANSGGGSGSGSVTEYAPRTKTPKRTITFGIGDPGAIAFSSYANIVAVANRRNDSVTCYDRTTGNRLRTITDGISHPSALLFDASGNLYVANTGTNAITVYQPASNAVHFKMKAVAPRDLTIDDDGVMWVAAGDNTLRVYDLANGELMGTVAEPFLAGVSHIVSGPVGYNWVISIGSAWMAAIVPRGGFRYKRTPTSSFAPTDRELKGPIAVAVGP